MTEPTEPAAPTEPTEPPGRRRNRRRRSSNSSHRASHQTSLRNRALLGLGSILGIALAAVVVAFVLGGGLSGLGSPTGSASGSWGPGGTGTGTGTGNTGIGTGTGLPGLVPVGPGGTSPDSFPAIPTDSASAPPSPSNGSGLGIRATRVRIERLGIDLAIVDGDGIDAPIGKAAHYPGTAWPGGGSNIYIYAHARVGMFLPLWQVAVGDQVILNLVDGTQRTYVVQKILPRVPWDAISYLAPTPTEQLTLQTSTSYYATAPRFVVIALPTP